MAAEQSSYRRHLRAAVATSAAPYGYTLTIWTTGAVTTHEHGIPSAAEALLFLLGAVLGFALTAAVAHGGPGGTFATNQGRAVRLWGGFHLLSVGAAIGLSAAAASLVGSPTVWPLVGFIATTIYLIIVAAQFTIAEKADEEPSAG